MNLNQLYTTKLPPQDRARLFETALQRDPLFESWHRIGRIIAEREMSRDEISNLFTQIEKSASAAGINRTGIGRTVDTTRDIAQQLKKAYDKITDAIQNTTVVKGFDAWYDDATDKLGQELGANSPVMQAINKYRVLAKQYPKTQGFIKAGLIAALGLATGGAGLPAIAGIIQTMDSAVKGDKLSAVIGKGAGAAALGYAAQQLLQPGAPDTATATQPGVQPATPGATYSNVDPGEIPGVTAFPGDPSWVQTDPGENPWTLAGQTDPGEVPGVTTVQPYSIDYNQPAATTPNTGQTYTGGIRPGADMAPGQNIGQATNLDVDGARQAAQRAQDAAQGNPYDFVYDPDSGELIPGDSAQAQDIRSRVEVPDNLQGFVRDASGEVISSGDGAPVRTGTPGVSPDAYARATQGLSSDQLQALGNADPTDPFIRGRLGLPPLQETIGIYRLPKVKLNDIVDRDATAWRWALTENLQKIKVRGFELRPQGVEFIFTEIENYTGHVKTLIEQRPGLLSRIGQGVRSGLSSLGQQLSNKFTKAKLMMAWKDAGSPTDSERLKSFLADQGLPDTLIRDVYQQIGLQASPKGNMVAALQKHAANLSPEVRSDMIDLLQNPTGNKPLRAGGAEYEALKKYVGSISQSEKQQMLKVLAQAQQVQAQQIAPSMNRTQTPVAGQRTTQARNRYSVQNPAVTTQPAATAGQRTAQGRSRYNVRAPAVTQQNQLAKTAGAAQAVAQKQPIKIGGQTISPRDPNYEKIMQQVQAQKLVEKSEANLRKTARTKRIMTQLRAEYPQAETDLEALLLAFRREQQIDRRDISRLDQENDQEETDIDNLEREIDQIQRTPLGEKQDACYRKVKSRYKVWPSAYASGALVQCRKKGAKNWGNKSTVNEGWRETLAALAAAGIMALSPGVSAADVAASSQQVPMIATIVVDGEVKKFDLTNKGFRDVREVEKFLDDFFARQGMPWQGRIERGVPGSGQYQRLIVQ